MHPLYEKANGLTGSIIKAGIEVHREMGPGLIESIYEKCLQHELQRADIETIRQEMVKVRYKDIAFYQELRYDMLVSSCVLVEVKAVKEVLPIHKAQLLSYMKLLDVPLGLVMNFHDVRLVDGICRLVLSDSNRLIPPVQHD